MEMKKEEKIAPVILGFILYIMAAFVTVGLLTQFLGSGSAGDRNILVMLGSMLFSVYGFSSVLIPVFLLTAGTFAFSGKWNLQKATCLFVSLVPFFTVSAAERLIRNVLVNDEGPVVLIKLVSISVITVLIVIAEYLLALVAAGKLADGKKSVKNEKNEDADTLNEENDSENEDNEEIVQPSEKMTEENEKAEEISEKSNSIEKTDAVKTDVKAADKEEDVLESAKKPVWSLKAMFSSESKNKTDEEELINAAVDASVNKAMKSEWTLEELLKTNGNKSLVQKEAELEAVDENKEYGNYSKGTLKEAVSAEEIAPLTETKFETVLPTSSDILKLDENFDKSKKSTEELPERNVAAEIEKDLQEINVSINLSSEDSTDDKEIAAENESVAQKNSEGKENAEISGTSGITDGKNDSVDMKSDPWNVMKASNLTGNGKAVASEKVTDDAESEKINGKNEKSSEKAEDAFDYEIQFNQIEQSEDEAGLVEQKNVPEMQNSQIESMENPSDEKTDADEEMEMPEESLEMEFQDLLDDEPVDENEEMLEDPFADDEKTLCEADVEITEANEEKCEHVDSVKDYEPEVKSAEIKTDRIVAPENKEQTVINSDKNSMVSALESIFRKMDQDARAEVEAEEAASKTNDYTDEFEIDEEMNYPETDADDEADEFTDDIADDSEDIDETIDDDFEMSEETDSIEENVEDENDGKTAAEDINESMNEVPAGEGKNEPVFDQNAGPVVDSHGNLISKQVENNLVVSQKPSVNAGAAANVNAGEQKLPPRKSNRGPYRIPTELLKEYGENQYWIIDDETKQAAENLKATMNEFKIEAEITGIKKGPVVTMFEMLPAPGVKLSRIVALQDNIALRLAASSVRIVAPIPGKRAVGIEVPNAQRAIVSFRECIEQNRPEWKKMAVPVILGKDIQGETQIMDLVKTPHLLIAGSTGAGKSVCVNSMILSILYKRSPNEVKMILIDPKIVELKLYNDIPHLLTPVITESKKAMQALQYCLCEMERRYALLDGLGVRDISNYNKRIEERKICTEKLPYIVVIIDEFADLMATTGKELESVVARLAAMSRAVGIHLVLATQRPSIDVITGLIKANIPSRIAFMVASKTDSRIIIDQVGADKLLGKGDMLYASATDPFPVRIQGTFISDNEVEAVVDNVKQWGEPEYIDDEIFIDDEDEEGGNTMSLFNAGGEDPLYEKALDVVIQSGKASASWVQRRLKIGYNRAARLIEEMEERGIVGPANGSKPREIIHMP